MCDSHAKPLKTLVCRTSILSPPAALEKVDNLAYGNTSNLESPPAGHRLPRLAGRRLAEALEEPGADEAAIWCDGTSDPGVLAGKMAAALIASRRGRRAAHHRVGFGLRSSKPRWCQ